MMEPTKTKDQFSEFKIQFTTGAKADFYTALAIFERAAAEDWNEDTAPAYWNEMTTEDLWMELLEGGYENADWTKISFVDFEKCIVAEGYEIKALSKMCMDGKRVSVPVSTIILN